MASWSKQDITFEIEEAKHEQMHTDAHNEYRKGQKKLLGAVKDHDLTKFRKLVSQGLDPDFKADDGESVVHRVVKISHDQEMVCVGMLELLTYFGTRMELCDRFGQTPLHIAASGTSLNVIHLLLQAGCNGNRRDNAGRTALMSASSNTSPYILPVTQMLLDWNCNVHLQDVDGHTALHYACKNSHQSVVTRNESVMMLLNAGASPNVVDNRGRIPIWYSMSMLLEPVNDTFSPLLFQPITSLVQGGSKHTFNGENLKLLMSNVSFTRSLFSCIHECLTWRTLLELRHYLYTHMPKSEESTEAGAGPSNMSVSTSLHDAVDNVLSAPRALRSMCRVVIRDSLGGQVYLKYEKLRIPADLQKYLVFEKA